VINNISGQFYNSYGKTSAIILDFRKDQNLNGLPKLLLYTETPIPPMAVQQEHNYNEKITFEQIKKFLSFFPEVKVQLNSNEMISMVKVTSTFNNTYYIPVEPNGEEDKLIPLQLKEITTFSLPKGISEFMKFNFNKRVAAYLGEYAKYLLAVWASEKNLPYIADKDIIQFVDSKIRLDPSYEYKDFPSQFGVVTEGFVQDGNIIFNREELLTRLVYYLRLEKDRIASYTEIKIIPVTYADILDFRTYQNQIMLEGGTLVMKYISNSDSTYQLTDKILAVLLKPYIFQNDLLDPNPYLAINVETADEALSIMSSWKRDKVMSKNSEIMELDPSFYEFVNVRQINYISGSDNECKILNYVNEDEEQNFTALLRI
jgi:hypothetical protein